MSFFSKVTEFFAGGVGTKIVEKVLKQIPDKLSEAEKSAVQAAVIETTREYEMSLLELARTQDENFNSRIKELEGTAADLKQFGILGKIIVFLRGAQRPIWGYFVLYMDLMVFSGQWKMTDIAQAAGNNSIGTNIESAFWVINFLVLGFLFGERAMKNVLPLVKGLQQKSAGGS